MLINRSRFFKHHTEYIQYVHLDSLIENGGSCSGLSCSKCIFGSDETKHLECLLGGLNYVKRKKIAKSYFTELFLNANIEALKRGALKEFKLSNKETIDLIMKRREEIPKENLCIQDNYFIKNTVHCSGWSCDSCQLSIGTGANTRCLMNTYDKSRALLVLLFEELRESEGKDD